MPRLANFSDKYLTLPDVSQLSWWSEFNRAGVENWNTNVVNYQVDRARTDALQEVAKTHPTVRCSTLSKSMPVKSGVPLQLASPRFTKTYEAKAKPSWNNLFPSKMVPFPEVVYILSNTDEQWFGLDVLNRKYYEVSATGPTLLGWPAPWRADTICVWDLTKDWRLQPRGITGAGIPLWPMVPKPEYLLSGKKIDHSIHFVAAGYAGEKTGIATKFDSNVVGHPLRAGERLRLRYDRVPVCKNVAETTLVAALLEYGMILSDKTDDKPESLGGPGHSMRLPADSRVFIDLDLKITDFEVVKAL